jgi:methionyl-tRNA synthetase
MQTTTTKSNSGPGRLVTTAIPYVNAEPHVGFALEVVQADALARFYRLFGDDVRFLAGTDENSIKNVQAADLAGVPVSELVERNAARYRALGESLDLSYDDFIRTSVDARHKPGVERLWKACFENGDIYKRIYRGLYCTGCEQFYKPDELQGGECPEHGTVPDEVEEENWFFRLSRYTNRLRDIYERGALEIAPTSRRNEVIGWIEKGLEDFSISRSAKRARNWGIPVPGDPGQVIYVWFDALANYITALGYATNDALLSRYWTDAVSREHVIGKGITRFHAIYWSAILLSAGLQLPTRIFVHGYVTVGGRKIGKSARNAVDPIPLAAELGADALRYYLLRHIRSTGDGDFSLVRFQQAYDSELAGQLGNLAHRVLSMIELYCGGVVPSPLEHYVENDRLLLRAAELPAMVAAHLTAYAFDRALDAIWTFIAEANRYVTVEEPWTLADAAASSPTPGSAKFEAKLRSSLFSLAASLFTIATCIAPLLPGVSQRLLDKLRGTNCRSAPCAPFDLVGRRVDVGPPLFPKR